MEKMMTMSMAQKLSDSLKKIWNLGVEDPRKVFHGLKVGLALVLVSLFYYSRPLNDGLGGNAIWAVLTVVVVLEFTVGGTIYKGFNRVVATFSAGSLALGLHWVATKSGHKGEPVIVGAALFILGFGATFSKFIPTIKARYDYGVTIFILTFSLVSVSGYRVEELMDLAQQRLSTIVIGCVLCLVVSMLLCPVWAGVDLHHLVIRNMHKLAYALEECFATHFDGDGSVDPKSSEKSLGYKAILNSKGSEDSLANLARWEPPHGPFSFRHPWKQYLKVTAAMRQCACCIETLHCSINSDIQGQPIVKKHLRGPSIALSLHYSKILKEIANSMKLMTISSTLHILVKETNNAVNDVQVALKTLPHDNLIPLGRTSREPEQVTEKQPREQVVPLMELVPLVSAAWVLIEISSRIEGIVKEVITLADLANFKPAKGEKKKIGNQEQERATEALEIV